MRLVLAFSLLLLPLAGCLADDPTDGGEAPVEPFSRKPALEFRAPVDLGSVAGILGGLAPVGAFGTSCQDSLDDGDCGLGEPSVEVDGTGTVYVSGVCCLTVAPPVLVSRDGGESWATLDTPAGLREAFGIEGDFAIDQEGRVYFSDIEFAATFQVTVWDKDGGFVRHTKWPAPPLVDRDWIRAEGDGTAYYVYNTGLLGTRVYKSTDAGQTWSPDAIHTVPYGLGNVAIDPGRELCLFGGEAGGKRSLDCSLDGGETWSTEQAGLAPGDDAYPVGAFDEAGNLMLAEANGGHIQVTVRDQEGNWTQPTTVSPPGTHRMPWLAAGAEGATAIAWYGTPDVTIGPETPWYLYAAASRDARAGPEARWDHVIADPEPVFVGQLERDLLDFLQIDMGPDGALHIAYSKLPADGGPGPDGNEEQLHYVRSEPSPLAMTEFWLGPALGPTS
ncbi:MAG: WD40/YVTN/BNR-like repeat-containing protein [Thermoplasmatota archaeon]